jgi:hypothetical protein
MKIAILGAAPSSFQLAPFGEVEWEIWACSPGNYKLPRIDAWFELHSLDRKWVPGNEPYVAALEKHPRVYVSKPDRRLPNGILYPRKEIMGKYVNYHHAFFSSSPAFMMAMAIELNPTHIGMWGIDMAAGSEWEYQRPGCHFFMGEAIKRGINLVIPSQSDIAQVHPLYAYKEHWPMYWKQKTRKDELQARVAALSSKIEKAQYEKTMLEGAMEDVKYIDMTFLQPPPGMDY